ncbi:MAG TPA: BrnT family toxin [Methylococcaceae bacterium]|jgi:uncharacterized DUF497 family protein|nr:BrnT family toxin [Methylococcaceae bacterium]
MQFEWDEQKRLSNLDKHGLDFLDVWAVFEDKHVIVPSNHDENEERFLAIGVLEGRFVTVIYTLRSDAVRVISFRRARHAEKRRYQELHG